MTNDVIDVIITDAHFKALDGLYYPTIEDVEMVNEAWRIINMPFIGKDGKPYGTQEDLDRANKEYLAENFPIISRVHEEIREILPIIIDTKVVNKIEPIFIFKDPIKNLLEN